MIGKRVVGKRGASHNDHDDVDDARLKEVQALVEGCAPFTYDPFTYHPFYLQVVGKRVGHHYWSSISQTDLNDPVSNSCNFLEFGQRIKLSS